VFSDLVMDSFHVPSEVPFMCGCIVTLKTIVHIHFVMDGLYMVGEGLLNCTFVVTVRTLVNSNMYKMDVTFQFSFVLG
jgi:hypothetical protein